MKKSTTKTINIDGVEITINLDSYFDMQGEQQGDIAISVNTKTMLVNRSSINVVDSYDHELNALKEI